MKMTEGMSQKRQDNNINKKIDRFFIYIIKKEKENPEKMTKDEDIGFKELLEKYELNYTEELINIFAEENIEKLKNEREITKEEGRNIAAKILGVKPTELRDEADRDSALSV